MTTRNLHPLKSLSRIFFRTGGLASAASLLACIVFSSPANATTFTLEELDQTGESFTIGNLEFFDFDINRTTADTSLLTLSTVDSEFLPGFVINGNGQWSITGFDDGGLPVVPEGLDFSYQVRTVNGQPLIGGALLWANDYSIEEATSLNITLTDGGPVDLDVLIFEPFGLPVTNLDLPADSVNLNPRLDSLVLQSTMDLSIEGIEGPQGPGVLNSYSMLFPVVVPEPGTALLMGLGLAGLASVGRSRGEES
jgi:hypothetical protein